VISGTYLLSGLWPPFAEAVRYLLSWADYFGFDVTLTSGYRSNQEQADLYRQGRTPAEIAQHVKKLGRDGAVTDAPPGYSAHNYGLAVDVDSPQLEAVMNLARQIGFGTVSWDPDHIEWPGWKSLVGL
jgi:LAS superfamily LD-carboxypeptidase LdcB